MERRIFLTALAGGLAVTTTAAFSGAQAAPAAAMDLAGVGSALQPAASPSGTPEEMQQRRRYRRRGPPPRRFVPPPRRRRRRCFINRRGLRVCRWY